MMVQKQHFEVFYYLSIVYLSEIQREKKREEREFVSSGGYCPELSTGLGCVVKLEPYIV
jgi:hypothetical protein